MLRFSHCPALGILVAFAASDAQQSNVTLSPYVNFRSSGSPNPMAGLALTISDGLLALRVGGQMSTQERRSAIDATSTPATRPWGADADAMLHLANIAYGELLTVSPYLFVGVSTSAVDSGAVRMRQQGWSYGSGLSLPMGSILEVLGEYRWRMSRFVSPRAQDAPRPTGEIRLGLAFRVGARRTLSPTVMPAGDEVLPGDGTTQLSDIIARVLSTADEYVGTRYRRGGASPSAGFDASGFVRFVFGQLGVVLPVTSRDQARVGERIRQDWHAIAPGDLLMFQDQGGINHVAIYVGRNRIIHASETGGGVVYDDLGTERGRWFVDHLVAVRRVRPDLRGLLLDLARAVPTQSPFIPDEPDRAPRPDRRRRISQP